MKTIAILAALSSYFGPGTHAQWCHRATAHSAICAYSAPYRGWEEEVGGKWEAVPSTWESYARVIWHHGRFRVSAPGIE